MEALKAIKIIGNQNYVFISSKYRVTKGFKFHAPPQTGAYSCYNYAWVTCGLRIEGFFLYPSQPTPQSLGRGIYVYRLFSALQL